MPERDPKLYTKEELKAVEEYINAPEHQVKRQPFKPWVMMGGLLQVLSRWRLTTDWLVGRALFIGRGIGPATGPIFVKQIQCHRRPDKAKGYAPLPIPWLAQHQHAVRHLQRGHSKEQHTQQ